MRSAPGLALESRAVVLDEFRPGALFGEVQTGVEPADLLLGEVNRSAVRARLLAALCSRRQHHLAHRGLDCGAGSRHFGAAENRSQAIAQVNEINVIEIG